MSTRNGLAWVLSALFGIYLSPAHAGLQDWIAAFAGSDIRFQRSGSAVPFPPIGFLDVSYYGDTELDAGDEGLLSFDQTVVSQAASLPLPLGARDAVLIGEWVNWSRFDSNTPGFESFEVWSVGLPVGWMRQIDPHWQTGAFAFPIAHKATVTHSDWSWQFLGGAFARYVQNERLWWGLGFYLDVGQGENLYLPYLGASWSIDDHWTLSAVLPWPGILYAPNDDVYFRLGASPSTANWSIDLGAGEVDHNFSGWDFGFSAGRRLSGNLWARIGVGYSGLKALKISDGGVQGPKWDADGTPFVGLGIEYRPSL